MDFMRKWLVGRDLKRARALEGEGYLEQALAVYESCLEMANDAGGSDNCTVVAVRCC